MTGTLRVSLPERASSREEARDILAPLLSQLDQANVILDARSLVATSSSYLDELIKLILVDGGANHVNLEQVTDTVGMLAENSAARRGVSKKLVTIRRKPQ